MIYAGIDWADEHHDVVVIDESAKMLGSLRVNHNVKGLAELVDFLKGLCPDISQLACVVETSRGLLIAALLDAGFTLYPVNPKTVDRKRGAAGAKTDKIDAYLLAKTGRSELSGLRPLTPDSPAVAELKELTRDQDHLIQMQTRLVNQLTASLKTYYPVALDLFSQLHQHSALIFLQTYPTPEEAMAVSVEELIAVLSKAGHTRACEFGPKIYEKLHQPHLSANAVITRTKSRLMLALVAQLLPLVAAIKAYDEEVKDLFFKSAASEIFTSLPGAGKRLAPRLLAEIGEDRTRYPEAANLQMVAGTAPVPFASGNFSSVRRRLACIKPLRNVLFHFAWESTQQEEWAFEYYRRKRACGKSHSEAVRALSNQWLRIIHAMWHKKKTYNREVFLASQKSHARRAA
jgi:transposase